MGGVDSKQFWGPTEFGGETTSPYFNYGRKGSEDSSLPSPAGKSTVKNSNKILATDNTGTKTTNSKSEDSKKSKSSKSKPSKDDESSEVGDEVGDDSDEDITDPLDFDPKTVGPILPNGDINWECPCLGGAAHGPCGTEFRSAFSCFHYSKEETKGSDCFAQFREMHGCFTQYPELYGSKDMDDDDDDEDDNPVEFDDDELKILDEVNAS